MPPPGSVPVVGSALPLGPVPAAGSAPALGSAPSPGPGLAPDGGRGRAWAELLRVSALFSVPGDALAGAAALGVKPGRGTAYAVGASLCLYEAGMALNDWADREEDAVDRPHRPLPSGRIAPAAALGAAGLLTAAGLALASRAGRPALAVATALAGTVWAYDLRLKHTPAAPAAMAAARALDLVLGAAATGPARRRPAVPASARRAPGPGLTAHVARRGAVAARTELRVAASAGALALHTYAVTAVSRHEAHGGSTLAPLGALAATSALGAATALGALREPAGAAALAPLLPAALYARTTAPPLLHAALNPSPPLTRHAVGCGIRAMIPLQAALAARAGAVGTGLGLLGLAPLARTLARKVSAT
ncbi:SCO3242 family prenyltransferase [Streptomyces sp. NPDC058758]|uniref:SCO3242 family prenyltransferase n=1 Tax=Streptomyces sp. NPDC058758 TaxID=3346627 RepID=UPI0036972846